MPEHMTLAEGQANWTPDKAPDDIVVHCGVCDAVCNEKRAVVGPTGWAEAMMVNHSNGKKQGHLHDSFICPHYSDSWHLQAMRLYWDAHGTKSPSLAKMYRRDAMMIVGMNLTDAPVVVEEHKSEAT